MTTAKTITPLVSAAWLASNLKSPNLKVVDASWYLPAMKRVGRTEFIEKRIPGAVFCAARLFL